MTDKVEHQGLVVDKDGDAIDVPGQGVVVKTEAGRFATLGADGNWHGYVPSTQMRDILNGEGEPVDEPDSPLDVARGRGDAKAVDVAGSEAATPTGAIDDFSPGGGMGDTGNVGADADKPLTDVDPTLAPATKDELDKRSGKR